jgi:Flp pilus assembly protein TadB/energy-coupling factor transporter ATP-binding protein EcfA2
MGNVLEIRSRNDFVRQPLERKRYVLTNAERSEYGEAICLQSAFVQKDNALLHYTPRGWYIEPRFPNVRNKGDGNEELEVGAEQRFRPSMRITIADVELALVETVEADDEADLSVAADLAPLDHLIDETKLRVSDETERLAGRGELNQDDPEYPRKIMPIIEKHLAPALAAVEQGDLLRCAQEALRRDLILRILGHPGVLARATGRNVVEMNRRDIGQVGGTGSGKTTLLNALSAYIPEDERLVTIEDAAELQLQQPHVAQTETRPPNLEGRGEITTRDLVRNALRMRPDRIIVGECRGNEALDMLQAMNTGHEGSMTTIHANNPTECMSRIENLVLSAGEGLPVDAIRQQIAGAVDFVVQVGKYSDGSRKILEIAEVGDVDPVTGRVEVNPIFQTHYNARRPGRGTAFTFAGRTPRAIASLWRRASIPRSSCAAASRGMPLTVARARQMRRLRECGPMLELLASQGVHVPVGMMAVAGFLLAMGAYGLTAPLQRRWSEGLNARYEDRFVDRLQFRPLSPAMFEIGLALLSLVCFAILFLFDVFQAILLIVFLLLAVALLPRAVYEYLRIQRRKQIDAVLPNVLQQLAANFRTTNDISRALYEVSETAPAPMDHELLLIRQKENDLRSFPDALDQARGRIGSARFDTVVSVLKTTYENGGKESNALMNLSRVFVQLTKMQDRLDTATQAGRWSMRLIIIMPVIVVVLAVNFLPDIAMQTWESFVGKLILGIALIFYIASIATAIWLSSVKI